MNIQQARLYARENLKSSPTAQLDGDVLLMSVLNCTRTELLFKKDKELSPFEYKKYIEYIDYRKTGLPVAYITGHKEFYGYNFIVSKDVLIPKPDTELLVEKTLNIIEEHFINKSIRICDMCTGSGCVGLSILKALFDTNKTFSNDIECTLVDISERALAITQKNVSFLDLTNAKVKLVQSDLFSNINEKFDIIVSNPPYIPHKEALDLLKDGRQEPLLALDGDVENTVGDGLGIIKRLVLKAREQLLPKGFFITEAGEYNAEQTKELFDKAGFKDTVIWKDLAGQLRDIQGHI